MSENIFADLYNKLLGFFRQAEAEENSKEVARNRLRVVLMQDRTNLTPQILERMRGELVDLLSRYLEMDKDALELNLEQDGEQMALALSIPVIRAKNEEEIQKAIEEEEARKAALAEETEEEDSEESEADEDTTEEESEETSEDVSEETENECEDAEDCEECNECKVSEGVECELKKKKAEAQAKTTEAKPEETVKKEEKTEKTDK